MSRLSDLFASLVPSGQQVSEMSNAEIAAVLKTSPEALAAFTSAYRSFEEVRPESENFFARNSRQAAAERRADPGQAASELIERIVGELTGQHQLTAGEPEGADHVSAAEVAELPEDLRPQLTGTMVTKDIASNSHPAILQRLLMAQNATSEAEHTHHTLAAMSMMDNMDLDPVVYQMLGQNPAAMGHWLPALEKAVASTGFFRVPETTVCKVPLPILQMTRLNYAALTPATLAIIDRWAQQAFELDPEKSYFIKTGTFSSKFDFRNARVTDPNEVMEIGQYLTYIHYQANQMGSIFNDRPIAGVSTTNEWVVREWIEDESDSPEIYHGMPLRTEFRVFIDCDTDEVLAVAPYWDPEVMLERFEQQADAADPDMRHDAIVFRAHQEVLTERFERFKDVVGAQVEALLPELELTGQWSLDIMLNDDAGEQLYAIDMAPAHTSALAHHVPAGKLKTAWTNWIPQLEI